MMIDPSHYDLFWRERIEQRQIFTWTQERRDIDIFRQWNIFQQRMTDNLKIVRN